MPGATVHVREIAHLILRSQPEVYRLSLVNPLLATCGCINHPLRINTKGGKVLRLQMRRDAFDVFQLTIEILELVDHGCIPKTQLTKVADERGVQLNELSGQITLHEEILIRRLDARRAADDI